MAAFGHIEILRDMITLFACVSALSELGELIISKLLAH